MALLITSFLILTNMSAAAIEFVGSAFTAMHVWFYACRLAVGGALLEFVWVLKKISVGPKRAKVVAEQKRKGDTICRYDYYAYIISNTLFITFCVVYAVVCLSNTI